MLPVLKALATEIIAGVPADLPSSNYLLRVSAADSYGWADPFSLPVQAVEEGAR